MAEFTFLIKGARFDRMPMERVAEYVKLLAELVGEPAPWCG